MLIFPLVYVKSGNIIDEEGKKIKNWRESLSRFKDLYIIDLDGIDKNQPNLDFYQRMYNKKWIDAFPRRFDDVMDIVVAGGDRVIMRDGFLEENLDKLFEEIEVDFYLSITEDLMVTKEHLIKDYKWKGFVYILNKSMDFEVKEFLSNLSNLYLVARRKHYIDFDWIEDKLEGLVYPLWEMES